jgi:hypothetical protein
MPPSATALVWLTAGRNRKVDAFVDAATDVLSSLVSPASRRHGAEPFSPGQ